MFRLGARAGTDAHTCPHTDHHGASPHASAHGRAHTGTHASTNTGTRDAGTNTSADSCIRHIGAFACPSSALCSNCGLQRARMVRSDEV